MANSIREKIINAFLDFLPPNCKDTAQLVSESMDRRVSIIQQWKIKYHLSLCEACRHYRGQLEIIRNLAENLKKDESGIDDEKQLKSSAKERMKELLKKNKQK